MLAQAGLSNSWWPLAAKCFCFTDNITRVHHEDGKTSWERRHNGRKFKWPKFVFGEAVQFLPNKAFKKRLYKFDQISVPGIFLGYHVLPGGRWKGDYLVFWTEDFKRLINTGGDEPRTIPIYRARDLKQAYPGRPAFFPLADRYETKKWALPTKHPDVVPGTTEPEPDEDQVRYESDGDEGDEQERVSSERVPVEADSGVTREGPTPSVDVREDPPEDQRPGYDAEFIRHGNLWFKGPWEIHPGDPKGHLVPKGVPY